MPTTDLVTSADAAHLLRRTGFGGSAAEIAALTGQTRAQAVAAVMGFTNGHAAPSGPDVGRPEWVVNDEQWRVHGDVIEWWVDRMATLPNPTSAPGSPPSTAGNLPIYERLAFFWHDHFACAPGQVGDIVAMWDQLGLFRRLALGNFADLTRAVSTSPAMLIALDNQHNTVWEPQENFGRELMELYTCGVGHFTETDVVAMTNAWTGHNTVGWNDADEFWDGTYRYVSDAHDHGQKTLFGITANWNGIAQHGGERDTIDELVYGVRQGRHRRSPGQVDVRVLRQPATGTGDHRHHRRPVRCQRDGDRGARRAVLEHDDFWADSSRWAQSRTRWTGSCRSSNRPGSPPPTLGLRWRMENMGMVPLDPPSVAGWGKGMAWLNTASAWARGSFAERLRWTSQMNGVFDGIAHLDRADAIDTVLQYFGIDDPSPQTRDRLMAWFDDAYANHRWSIPHQARMLGALTPEFQVY